MKEYIQIPKYTPIATSVEPNSCNNSVETSEDWSTRRSATFLPDIEATFNNL